MSMTNDYSHAYSIYVYLCVCVLFESSLICNREKAAPALNIAPPGVLVQDCITLVACPAPGEHLLSTDTSCTVLSLYEQRMDEPFNLQGCKCMILYDF